MYAQAKRATETMLANNVEAPCTPKMETESYVSNIFAWRVSPLKSFNSSIRCTFRQWAVSTWSTLSVPLETTREPSKPCTSSSPNSPTTSTGCQPDTFESPVTLCTSNVTSSSIGTLCVSNISSVFNPMLHSNTPSEKLFCWLLLVEFPNQSNCWKRWNVAMWGERFGSTCKLRRFWRVIRSLKWPIIIWKVRGWHLENRKPLFRSGKNRSERVIPRRAHAGRPSCRQHDVGPSHAWKGLPGACRAARIHRTLWLFHRKSHLLHDRLSMSASIA